RFAIGAADERSRRHGDRGDARRRTVATCHGRPGRLALQNVQSSREVLAMSERVCPLNNRTCRCDPTATHKKSHPCMLAKRIGKLIRLVGANFEGEAIGSATGLRRLLQSEGLAFNDLATLIENCDGQIEKRKYSDTDAEIIFARGMEKGRAEEARK